MWIYILKEEENVNLYIKVGRKLDLYIKIGNCVQNVLFSFYPIKKRPI